MEIIVASSKLGSFFDGDGCYDVYAEVCRLPHIGRMEWVSRLVECPDGYPDKLLERKDGMASEAEAAASLANMVEAYRRAH